MRDVTPSLKTSSLYILSEFRPGGGGGEAGLSRAWTTNVEACLSSPGSGPNETRFTGLVGLPVPLMLAVAQGLWTSVSMTS